MTGVALCVYLLAVAIVPPGHMAASLDSGSAFHLCGGDLRSAQILRALAPDGAHAHTRPVAQGHAAQGPAFAMGAAPGPDGAAGNTGHGQHGLSASFDNDGADNGCLLAAGAGMAAATAATAPGAVASPTLPLPHLLSAAPGAARWLRPPVRSPPGLMRP